MLAAAGIRRSRLGRAFVAIAGSEDAARALGIDVARYKLIAFLISAFYAAVAGSLFVHAVGFVSPEVYGLHMVVLAFTMLYVGGIGTIAGAALGALVIALLPETLRRFSEYQDLAYGAVLILILIYAPGGLASLSRLVVAQAARRRMTLLRLDGVTRRFGGLVAVDDVSLDDRSAVASPRSSGRTAPARRRCSMSSRASPRRARAASSSPARTSPAWRRKRSRRRGLVRTFQLVQLFENLTVLENVKVGRHLHTSRRAWQRAAAAPRARAIEAGVEAFARELLDKVGLDAHADTLAGVLPYGQKRLLEIARALAAEPKLLLLDEPAAGLNRGETTRLADADPADRRRSA